MTALLLLFASACLGWVASASWLWRSRTVSGGTIHVGASKCGRVAIEFRSFGVGIVLSSRDAMTLGSGLTRVAEWAARREGEVDHGN